MKVVYSFNKIGQEAEIWQREIARASTSRIQLVPFNHQRYLHPDRYIRAQLLDNLYYDRDPRLLALHDAIRKELQAQQADVLLVDNCPPYHPEFLRTLSVYKVLRICDGPISAYDRDFAYLHAYDHVLFHSPAYSSDLTMAEKLRYCGAKRFDLWPLWVFDGTYDPTCDEERIRTAKRPIDVVFVGAFHRGKLEQLAKIKRHFKSRCVMHGLINLKKNLYFNARHGMPGWIRPIRIDQYVPLYQQAKVGFNVHNRGKYTVGNYRLFELPANGVMQVSDGGEYLEHFFSPGREIIEAEQVDDIIERMEYFLVHDRERREIAVEGFRAAMTRHRFKHRVEQLADILGSAR